MIIQRSFSYVCVGWTRAARGLHKWAAPTLTRKREDGLQAYPQICSAAQKTATPIKLQCSSGHLVKHLAKLQANKCLTFGMSLPHPRQNILCLLYN